MAIPILIAAALLAAGGGTGFDLGGECIPPGDDLERALERLALIDPVEEAAEGGRFLEAAELQKRVVRSSCGWEFAWSRLAELYLLAGKEDLAVEVLETLYARGAIDVEKTLEDEEEPLHALLDREVFSNSSLAEMIQAARDASEVRLAAARTRLESLGEGRLPPVPYIARGACPFECCVYRDWVAREQADLYEGPGGTRILGTIAAGEWVTAVTGEVHLQPAPVLVIHPMVADGLEAGGIIFLLDYLGEGYYRAWHDGRVLELEAWDQVRDYCPHAGEDCWGEYLFPASTRTESVWWVEIRRKDGSSGWIRQPERFGNKDACG